MAPPTKMQKVKSKIRQQAEFWAGMLEEIPFLDELEDISEAVTRGQKRRDEVQAQVEAAERRLAALAEEEREKKLDLAKHVSTATSVAEAAERRLAEATSRSDEITKTAEEGARSRAAEIVAAAHVEARRIVEDSEARYAATRARRQEELDALEKTILDLRREEEELSESVREARALRARLTQLEPV